MKFRVFNIIPISMQYKQYYRALHLTKVLQLNPNNVTEVRVPVPWGHIAGKWWGNINEQPILALHGWQDNAGSFDPLLELLPESKPVLAIDSPGHGFSSHFPKGMLYHNANYIMMCRRIENYFKWDKKITFLGHSEGGIIAFLFSTLYPESVNALITLDAIKPIAIKKSFQSNIGKVIDECITKSRRGSGDNPKYSLEEILNRRINTPRSVLTTDAVKVLMKRGIQLNSETGKFTFTHDPKLKSYSLQRFDENQSLEMAFSLNCHCLVLKFGEGFVDSSLENAPTFISTLTQVAKSFKLVSVEGNHHAHLTNPERVAPIISEFIKNINL